MEAMGARCCELEAWTARRFIDPGAAGGALIDAHVWLRRKARKINWGIVPSSKAHQS